ncbi:hypothetical protein F4775DRAFT_130200 [Biscogniauxia sp. FL1348]|nr:hypothetical protein F4775DRAFT_130200 [Biscogniauxia sp. FL1348]
MRSISLLLLAFASYISRAAASTPRDDLAPRAVELGPWEVTRLHTFSPSGRPGSSTQSSIMAVISSPEIAAGPGGPTGTVVFPASTANCTAAWEAAGGSPYGTTHDCAAVSDEESSPAAWTFEAVEAASGANPTENVALRFTLTYNVTADGSAYYKVLEGTGHFLLPDNMEGACGGSGVCNWYLKDESTPYRIQPTLTACQGTC